MNNTQNGSITHSVSYSDDDKKNTRKSCVNVRGILPAGYQVLHLLSYPGRGGGGTPSLAGGTPSLECGLPHPWSGYTHLDLAKSNPHPDLARVPSPRLDLARIPPPPPSGLVGVPPLWTWPGYPPPRCEQTQNMTFPMM